VFVDAHRSANGKKIIRYFFSNNSRKIFHIKSQRERSL